jgi:hypothetical protein
MSCLLAKLSLVKVVVVTLITPRLNARRHVDIADSQILAVGTARVLKFAVVVVVEVVGRKLLECAIPGQ